MTNSLSNCEIKNFILKVFVQFVLFFLFLRLFLHTINLNDKFDEICMFMYGVLLNQEVVV